MNYKIVLFYLLSINIWGTTYQGLAVGATKGLASRLSRCECLERTRITSVSMWLPQKDPRHISLDVGVMKWFTSLLSLCGCDEKSHTRRKRRIFWILNSWKSTKNLGSTVEITWVRWKSLEYNGNPGSTMGILGVQWESREYNGNPGSTMGIPGIQWESWEYNGNPGGAMGILEVRCILSGYP